MPNRTPVQRQRRRVSRAQFQLRRDFMNGPRGWIWLDYVVGYTKLGLRGGGWVYYLIEEE